VLATALAYSFAGKAESNTDIEPVEIARSNGRHDNKSKKYVRISLVNKKKGQIKHVYQSVIIPHVRKDPPIDCS